MKELKKIIVSLFLILITQTVVLAQNRPLAKDAPERSQLSAMGYELLEETKDAVTTFAIAPSGMVLGISKAEDRTAVSRFFVRQKKVLTPDEELRLLRKINELNRAYYLQAAVMPEQIIFSAYLSGEHNTRQFARTISWLELIPSVIFEDKELLELLNGKKSSTGK